MFEFFLCESRSEKGFFSYWVSFCVEYFSVSYCVFLLISLNKIKGKLLTSSNAISLTSKISLSSPSKISLSSPFCACFFKREEILIS